MRKKIVLWASRGQGDENDKKVLLAIELLPTDNKTKLYIFEEPLATKELEEQLMINWRGDKEFELPEGFELIEKDLSAASGLLPEDIRTERGDLIQRAHTEWLFIALSTKMYETYQSELDDLRDRVSELKAYDKSLWEELKAYWEKVQTQIRERNLFQEHMNLLRSQTNDLFSQLKELRSVLDAEFETKAQLNFDRLNSILSKVEEGIIDGGLDMVKAFNQLKNLQKDFRNSKLTRNLRGKIWDRMDKAFKVVKEKRFGSFGTQEDRLKKRMDGLEKAIEKMERSIDRDEKEMEYQDRRINSGQVTQLEMQLREAKNKLVKERIKSKKDKLEDMHKTQADLQKRLEKLKSHSKKEEQAKTKTEVKTEEKPAEPVDVTEDTEKTEEKVNTPEQTSEVPIEDPNKEINDKAIDETKEKSIEDDTIKPDDGSDSKEEDQSS